MSFTSWLQNLSSRRAREGKRNRRCCRSRLSATHRLQLEPLEDRRLMALLGPVDYSVGTEPNALVAADFNNDSVQDLAVGTANNQVRVLLGVGDGTFQPGPESETGLNFEAGVTWYSLAVGDFDRDGNLDLAAADGTWATVLLGDGEGAFEATYLGGNDGVESVAAGDFNGDGLLDLGMTSNYPGYYGGSDGYAEVWLGNGDGTFSEQPNITPLGGTSSWFSGAVAADINGDNFDDFVTVLNSARRGDPDGVYVLFGGSAGELQGPYFFSTGGEDSLGPVAAGDLDADGDIDLVKASAGATKLHVLLGDGAGGFSAPTSYDSAGGWSLILGDFTGDGNLDVAHSITQNLSVFPGQGDGTLAPRMDFAVSHSSYYNGMLAAGDFNGDGWLDAAINDTSDQAVAVLLNDQSWQSPPPPSLSISDRSVTEGNTGTAIATFTVNLSSPSPVDVAVHYATSSQTATAGSDYQAVSGTLTIPAGQTTGTITVLVSGDRLVEASETFFVNLSGATGAAIDDGQGVAIILDDEPRISISDVTQYEGRNGTTQFTFTVMLSAAYDQPVTMSYKTVNGTATTSNNDYTAKTGTLTFAPGESIKYITIEVKGDSKREANETFYLDLFGLSSNALFTKNRGIGTILNDD